MSRNIPISEIKRIYESALKELNTYWHICEREYNQRVEVRNNFVEQEKQTYFRFLRQNNTEMCLKYQKTPLPDFVKEPPIAIRGKIIAALSVIDKEPWTGLLMLDYMDLTVDFHTLEKYGYTPEIQKWLQERPVYKSAFECSCVDEGEKVADENNSEPVQPCKKDGETSLAIG